MYRRIFSLYFRVFCTSFCCLHRVYWLPGSFPAFQPDAGGSWISEHRSFSLPRLCTSYKSTYHKAINTGAFPVMLFFQHVHHQWRGIAYLCSFCHYDTDYGRTAKAFDLHHCFADHWREFGKYVHTCRKSPEPVSGFCIFPFHRNLFNTHVPPYSFVSGFAGCCSLYAPLYTSRHRFPDCGWTAWTEKISCLSGTFYDLPWMCIPPDPISCYVGSRPYNFAFY